MSEVKNTSEEALFQSLEKVYLEDKVAEVLEHTRLYNELLRDQRVDETHINEIMKELDSEWEDFVKQSALFSGIAYFKSEADENIEQAKPDYYDDTVVLFRGICPFTDTEKSGYIHENDAETPRYYQLRLLFERTGIKDNGDEYQIPGTVTIDELASLEFLEAMSVGRGRNLLEQFHGELVEDIDIALLNTATHEADSVVRLRDLELDVSGVDPRTIQQLLMALNVYTQDNVKLDNHNGYSITFNGKCWIEADGNFHHVRLNGSKGMLAVAQEVVWRRGLEENKQIAIPHLKLQFMGQEVDSLSPLSVYVPIYVIDELTPLRYEYFEKKVHDQESSSD